jgi:hypothetical protein
MDKTKSKNIIIIFLIIVILALVVVGLFNRGILKWPGSKTIKTTNSEVSNVDTAEDDTLDTNSRLVKELYNEVVDDRFGYADSWIYGTNSKILATNMSEEAKLSLVYLNLKKESFAYLDKCPTNDKTIVGDYKVTYTCIAQNEAFIKTKDVADTYNKIFGIDSFKADSNNYMYTNRVKLGVFIYDKDLDGYALYTNLGGMEAAYSYTRTISKATKSNDEIKIYEKLVKVDPEMKQTIENDIYTFKLDKDNLYTFYSREIEK